MLFRKRRRQRTQAPFVTGADGRAEVGDLPAMPVSVALWRNLTQEPFGRWALPEPMSVSVVPAGQEVVFAFREANPIRGTVAREGGAGTKALVSAWRDGP